MASPSTTNHRTGDFGWEVDVVDIDRRLKDLWDKNETVSRASLLNLVIYSEESDSIRRNTDLVVKITQEHACRVLLVEARPDEEKQAVRSWITAHCGLTAEGKKAVCCEQVAFRLDGLSPTRLVNLIFAHVESDLPLILWWQASLRRHFDRSIYHRIDRLVVDSLDWGGDWMEEFRMLLRASRDRANHFVVHDLNWTRLFHCRLAIAACFESPTASADLSFVEEIEIRHGQGFRSTALLLAGWICERLGGTVVAGSASRFVLELKTSRHRLAIVLAEEGGDGAIDGVRFQMPGAGYRIASDREQPFYKIGNEAEGDSAAILMPRDCTDTASLLIDQLGRGSSNASYFQIMQLAASMQSMGRKR